MFHTLYNTSRVTFTGLTEHAHVTLQSVPNVHGIDGCQSRIRIRIAYA